MIREADQRGLRNFTKQNLLGEASSKNDLFRQEEPKTCSGLKFLKPLLREATQKIISFARKSRKGLAG